MNVPPEKYHLCPNCKNDVAFGEDLETICEKCAEMYMFFMRIEDRNKN